LSHLRHAAALALAAFLAVTPAAMGQGAHVGADPAAHAPDRPSDDPAYRLDRGGITLGGSLHRSGPFTGTDGQTYEPAPLVVNGRSGRAFFGEEFDAACWYGRHLGNGLRQLARLSRTIERSGRHALFTIAPNKSSVATNELPAVTPHGRCDTRGLKQQNRILDQFGYRSFVPLRAALESQSERGANVYWHLDTHWTTVAAAEFAEGVADKLNPRIAELQRYRTKRESIQVDLGAMGLIDQKVESGRVRVPGTGVETRPADGSGAFDADKPVDPDLSWRTAPAKRTWRGNTLLLGDSFTYRGLSVLMPLFRHGRFLWLNTVDNNALPTAIAQADTVVFEIVQRYVGVSVLVQKSFRQQVKQALKAYDAAK